MATEVSFHKLGLKSDIPVREFEIEGTTVEVKQYLPSREKVNLTYRTVVGSIVEGMIRRDVLDVVFHLEIVKKYTNLKFTEKQLSTPFELFDKLELNGVIQNVLVSIPEREIDILMGYRDNLTESIERAKISSLTGYSVEQKRTEELIDVFESFKEEGR